MWLCLPSSQPQLIRPKVDEDSHVLLLSGLWKGVVGCKWLCALAQGYIYLEKWCLSHIPGGLVTTWADVWPQDGSPKFSVSPRHVGILGFKTEKSDRAGSGTERERGTEQTHREERVQKAKQSPQNVETQILWWLSICPYELWVACPTQHLQSRNWEARRQHMICSLHQTPLLGLGWFKCISGGCNQWCLTKAKAWWKPMPWVLEMDHLSPVPCQNDCP